jgi:hypothetical protein
MPLQQAAMHRARTRAAVANNREAAIGLFCFMPMAALLVLSLPGAKGWPATDAARPAAAQTK